MPWFLHGMCAAAHFALWRCGPILVLQCEYFDAPGSLRHMTLHAAADPARGRALYALHLPADSR